jgi:hypothetical protein
LYNELDVLQNLLYADRRFSCWRCCRATDTSGKDGTLRGVFGRNEPAA